MSTKVSGFKIINKSATWITSVAKFLTQLEQNKVKNFPKIPIDQFEGANSKEQTQLIKHMLPEVLRLSKVSTDRNLKCPFHQPDNNPSMVYNPNKYDLHCFACNEPGEVIDIFDLLGILYGIRSSFALQKQKAISLFVERGLELAQTMRINSNSNSNQMQAPASAKKAFDGNHSRVYVPFWDDKECMDYLSRRGISQETAKRFNLKSWEFKLNKYLIIPCVNGYYVRRKFKDGDGNYPIKWNKKDVSITLFNDKCLEEVDDSSTIFILEAAIDAITVEQAGFHAIAINGSENYSLILEKAEILREKHLRCTVLLDNDSAGLKAGYKVARQLYEAKISAYCHDYKKAKGGEYLSNFKDINEAYIANARQATKALEEISNVLNTPLDFGKLSKGGPTLIFCGMPIGL